MEKPRLREDRLRLILDLVQKMGSVHISDLSRRFGVSEMTIHRDLEELASRGLIRRVRGGAVPVVPQEAQTTTCLMCHMAIPHHTRVVLHLDDGSQHHACCPHCALVYALHTGHTITTILVRDLLHQHVVDARRAYYVVDSDLVVCCQPSVLAFQNQEDAIRFQRGFNGRVMAFTEVLQFLRATTQSTQQEVAL